MTDNMNNTKSCSDSHLRHQSNLFDVTAPILPFLLEKKNQEKMNFNADTIFF